MAIKNVLSNGNFETNDVWIYNGLAARVSDGNAMNSVYCCRFPNMAQGGVQQAYQHMMVVPGTNYTLSFYAKRTGRMDVWAAYQYMNASGGFQTVYSPSMLGNITGSYTKQSWTFSIPATASPQTGWIMIHAGGNPGDTATAWVDNVDLWGEEYIPTPPPLPDPGPHPAGVNHLTNGGLESAGGWSFAAPCGIVNDNANAKEGGRCLTFPYKPTYGVQTAQQRVAATPGKEYILSFYAKRRGRLDLWAGHSYHDAQGGYHFFNGPSLLWKIPDSGPYRRQEYRFSLPADAQNACIVYIKGGNEPSDTGVVAYVDDVVLVRADGQASPGLPADVVGLRAKGFCDTASTPLGVRTEMNGGGTKVTEIPRHDALYYYATTNPAWHYVEYNGFFGYADAQYIVRGVYVNYTGSDPIEKIRAYSQSYRYKKGFILVSQYLAKLDERAKRTNYAYPVGHGNKGYWPDDKPNPTICCAYMPFEARKGEGGVENGFNNVPGQKAEGSLITGLVANLPGGLIKGMEVYQGNTHMGVYAGVQTIWASVGPEPSVYQSIAGTGSVGNVRQKYLPDTNAGPNLTSMNSTAGWPEWGWPLGVISEELL